MKSLLRNTALNAISLFVLTQILSGIKVNGGFGVLLFSGFVLSLLFVFLRPVLHLFSLPLNLVTLGLFSFFTNSILLYLLTVFVPNVVISSFTFNGWNVGGFIVPVMHFGSISAYFICAAGLSIIINFFNWLIK